MVNGGSPNLFTVKIHYGGRFYSQGGVNRHYMGGSVVFVDGVVLEKLVFTSFNYWANDLGYTQGPIAYWFRIAGSEAGSGYLPIATDAEAEDMVQFIPSTRRILDVYLVYLGERKTFYLGS